MLAVAGAVLLVAATAGATAYVVDRPETPVQKAQVERAAAPQAAPQRVACNDGNIAGKALGGVGGGVAGSMIGSGSGKTAATIGGTLGGAYIGGEVIPLNNVTCR